MLFKFKNVDLRQLSDRNHINDCTEYTELEMSGGCH